MCSGRGCRAGIVPNFVDQGVGARAEAERSLADARAAVLTAGDAGGSETVGNRRHLEDALRGRLTAVELAIPPALESLRGTVKGLHAFGNALIQNPDELIELLGGLAALIGGETGVLGGGAVSGTGVGALVGAHTAAGS